MAVAIALTAELLRFPSESHRAKTWMDAVAQPVAGVQVVKTTKYRGTSELLVLWGPGAPDRMEVMSRHVAAGGHVIACDLSYWQRDLKVRISIDAPHPQAWVMRRDWSGKRLAADGVRIADRWHWTGPIVIAGIGRKARLQYGDAVAAWEAEQIALCRSRWPDRRIVYRRKQVDSPVPSGVVLAPPTDIEQVLDRASLLITWHSNVAVDAIRLGIPVICRDGAAAAVCPSSLGSAEPLPLDPDIRQRFLANLAWFQWAPSETARFWSWLSELLA